MTKMITWIVTLLVLLCMPVTPRAFADASLGGFVLGDVGRIGVAPEEVIAGTRSIVG